MKIVERSIKDLIPAEYNPRQLSNEQATHLEASLKRFGAVDPAIINTHPDRKNIIIGGHQRLKTAQRLGWETFPCVELELDKERERELNIRLNKNTGGWDYDALANYFEVEELTDWGFSDEELFGDIEAEELEAEEDDYQEPDDIKVDVVLGDLIEIGPHRLLCGDSTDSDQMAKLMNGEKADMVFTDPPYGVNYSNADRPKPSKRHFDVIKNDDIDLTQLLPEAFNNLFIYSKDDCAFYIWYADKTTLEFYLALNESKINFNQMLIWKKPMLLGRNKYQYAYEPCIFATKGTPFHTEDRTKTTVWDFGGYDKSKNQHPTQKPLVVPSEAIMNSSKEGFLILDIFLGSGSTMVASHQLKRKCYGMELDPKYCQVIIDRMRKLDDTLEIKINGEPYGVQD